MGINELDKLLRLGQLKAEPPTSAEIEIHLQSGRDRLRDALVPGLSLSSRFLLLL